MPVPFTRTPLSPDLYLHESFGDSIAMCTTWQAGSQAERNNKALSPDISVLITLSLNKMQTLTETEPLLSTRQPEAEIEASPLEAFNEHASHLNLKLFFSLLADSIPGQRSLIIW